MKKRNTPAPTKCWDCKNAVGGCSWSSRFIPVDGWDARETTIRGVPAGARTPSYHVISCPEFVPDGAGDQHLKSGRKTRRKPGEALRLRGTGLTVEEIAELHNVSPGAIYKWLKRDREEAG